jgi:hypothetical protein
MDAGDGYMLLLDLSGLKMCSDRIWTLFGYSLRWSRVHGWIHAVSKPKDQLITSRLDEWMVFQRMISKGAQIILTI